MKRRWNRHEEPENFCPICDREIDNGHRCPEATLRGIDAAHKRTDIDGFDEGMALRPQHFWVRLKDGFDMLRAAYKEKE